MSTTTITDRQPRVKTRFWILMLILFLSVVAYADRSILSIAGSAIQGEFGLSSVQLGYIMSAFGWAYVLGQLPGGYLLDRFGAKAIYGTALCIWSTVTLLVGFVGEMTTEVTVAVNLLFTLRFILGFVEAPIFPANARIAIMWFPKLERGRASALFTSSQYFSVGIFSPLAGWLVSNHGWPWPFFVLGIIGLFASLVWAVYMHEPRKHPKVTQAELDYIIEGGALVDIDSANMSTGKPKFIWGTVKGLLNNRMLWCAYIGQYCAVALSYFFITWFLIYLVQDRGMDILHAGFATIAPSLMGLAGGISGGFISDYLVNKGWSISWARKLPYILGMLLASTLAFASMADSNFLVVAFMTIAFYGKGVAAGAGTWTIISDTAPKDAVGLAGSIFNCFGHMAGIVTPIAFGYIVGMTGNFSIGIWFVSAHCILAALLFAFVMGEIKRVGE
ncbi:MFS transporter [Klebsiella pneumoniae]